MTLLRKRNLSASLGGQPRRHFTEEPIIAAVDGQMPGEETITLPAPDCHVRDRDHLAQHAPRQQPLLTVKTIVVLRCVRVCHGPKNRAFSCTLIWTAAEKVVTSKTS